MYRKLIFNRDMHNRAIWRFNKFDGIQLGRVDEAGTHNIKHTSSPRTLREVSRNVFVTPKLEKTFAITQSPLLLVQEIQHITAMIWVIAKNLTWISRGETPLTVQPTELHVPSISFTVPARLLAIDRSRMMRAMSITWSSVTLPLCLMCFTWYSNKPCHV